MATDKKIVNLDYLMDMSGGNSEIIRDMIDLFIGQIPEFLQEMNELYGDNKWKELGALAHKAKSSVAIMGMDDLADKLKELELKTKNDEDIDTYQQYITLFDTQTQQAISELEEFLKKM